MIRGHDSGKCNMHVIINCVYAISGNTHMEHAGNKAGGLLSGYVNVGVQFMDVGGRFPCNSLGMRGWQVMLDDRLTIVAVFH